MPRVPLAALRQTIRWHRLFPFLSRFTYGNFGNPNQFGMEM